MQIVPVNEYLYDDAVDGLRLSRRPSPSLIFRSQFSLSPSRTNQGRPRPMVAPMCAQAVSETIYVLCSWSLISERNKGDILQAQRPLQENCPSIAASPMSCNPGGTGSLLPHSSPSSLMLSISTCLPLETGVIRFMVSPSDLFLDGEAELKPNLETIVGWL
jgi:hypothetical protein